MKNYYYNHLVCGGTFDHLHSGHRHFLNSAFSLARYVSIGLTNYPVYNKPYAGSIQPYQQRKKTIVSFLLKKGWGSRTKITPIIDLYGPSIKNPFYDAILITKNTKYGAKKINTQRKIAGFRPLTVIQSDWLDGLSSTAIRFGRNLPEKPIFLPVKTMYLPAKNRRYFKAPLGSLIYSPQNLNWPAVKAKTIIAKNKPPFVAVVGDIAVHSFIQNSVFFNLAVVDYKSQRLPVFTSLHHYLTKKAQKVTLIPNPPGSVSAELNRQCRLASQQNGLHLIEVSGEEDLAVLPLILSLPLNSLIFYGQPGQGLVAVKVTIGKKQECLKLLKYFI